jgi:hypothetical protein
MCPWPQGTHNCQEEFIHVNADSNAPRTSFQNSHRSSAILTIGSRLSPASSATQLMIYIFSLSLALSLCLSLCLSSLSTLSLTPSWRGRGLQTHRSETTTPRKHANQTKSLSRARSLSPLSPLLLRCAVLTAYPCSRPHRTLHGLRFRV